jgi:hypothetical protein
MSPARLEARMESLFSVPVGLFHPLQHAGLSGHTPSRRSGSSRLGGVAIKESGLIPSDQGRAVKKSEQ